MRSTYKY